ncbi:hypothetical protein SAMN05421693_11273 [Ectothiorhodospira magna]|uniref:PD-(D/E)XK nuclease superfamily protein n=1 Tax=Ectothiorhodospira magna TaxID=867345 RepID=A0A1H9C6H1_9GAMM|nr:hypothetical protein [Ectothiorhodospira magna]SEP96796.1 hypothetical protein SAMN05421693_11273 [Ectothiorhodospira magna]
MLHAIAQRKSRIYRRYMGHKDDNDEKRVAAEDEITALILGPLKFLTPEERARFWHHLLIRCGANALPPKEPEDVHMELWKRFSGIERKVEPDLMVYLRYPDQTIPVIVELKWRAPLSGNDQLHLQWEHCLDEQGRKTGFHLFIAPETSAASAAMSSQEHGNPWQGRLLAVDWASIKDVLLRGGIFKTTEAKDWANNVCLTLERIGIRAFRGFTGLPVTSIPAPFYGNVFWGGVQGWTHIAYTPVPTIKPVVFFSSP